jgi:hypothetical protein
VLVSRTLTLIRYELTDRLKISVQSCRANAPLLSR